jgi:hypothetical protein
MSWSYLAQGYLTEISSRDFDDPNASKPLFQKLKMGLTTDDINYKLNTSENWLKKQRLC